jgi:hypothetical protein
VCLFEVVGGWSPTRTLDLLTSGYAGQQLSTPGFCRSDRDNAPTEAVSVVMFVEHRNDQGRLLQWIEPVLDDRYIARSFNLECL